MKVPRSNMQEAGSFFDKSKLSLQTWLVLLHWWCRQNSATDAAEEAKVTEATAVQVYQYFHDICSWRLFTLDSPLMIGGQVPVWWFILMNHSSHTSLRYDKI